LKLDTWFSADPGAAEARPARVRVWRSACSGPIAAGRHASLARQRESPL